MKKNPHPEKKLARAYVPDQVYADRWGPMEGLKKGTIFPELHQPYVKGVQKKMPEYSKPGHQMAVAGRPVLEPAQRKMLFTIQAVEFTVLEFNLYLDTHPEDRKALNDYNKACRQLLALKRDYEARYGPFANFGSATSQFPWQWIDEPWPWEISF